MAQQRASISSTQVVPNLIQGVSQQASQQRRDAQCEEQFDCINSVLEGCAARPPMELVRMYPALDLDGSLFSEANYEDEAYLTGVSPTGSPFAFDLSDGTPCTIVNEAGSYAYLTSGAGEPRDKLRAQVQDDYTFLANRTMTVAMGATLSPALPKEAMVFVRSTTFNSRFNISLNGVGNVFAETVTDPDTVTSTGQIASELQTQIEGINGYTCVRYGSVLHIYRGDGTDFVVTTSDGQGDDYMRAFKGTCQSFERLPQKAPTGFTLKVQGEQRTGNDDYYVRFVGSPSTGGWQEVLGPSIATSLNPATMPHALVNTAFRQFNYRQLTWSSRVAGDDVTAKVPEFVGKTIRDLTYFNRRLGVIHRAGTVFSKTDAPFTFFVDTVQTVLATAPIDTKVASGTKKGSPVLDFAVLVAESLFVWAQKTQFRIDSGQDPFKQDTIDTKPASAYEYSPGAYPLDVGSFLFMPTDVGDWASLRAIMFNNGRVAGDVDVSSHISKYIPSGVRTLTGSDTLRCVMVQSDGDRSALVLFNYTWDGQQFIQSAFNTWRIPGGDILWASIDKNYLRVLQQRPEGVALLRANLTPKAVDAVTGAKYMTRLDMRLNQSGVTGLTYDEEADTTSFTLPYIPTGPDVRVVLGANSGDYTRGRVFPVLSVVGSVVTVRGDLTGSTFYVGQRIYATRLESEFFIRGDKGAEPTDRITLNRVKLSMSDTGYSRIEVRDTTGKLRAYPFEARVLGTASSMTGTPELRTDSVDAPVGGVTNEVSIRLVNDSFLPSYWQNLSYDFDAVGWKGAK